jgi:hypothetical protein
VDDQLAIAIASMPSLEEVGLGGDKITDATLEAFSKSKSIMKLSLYGDNITEKGAKFFLENDTLTEIHLSGDKIPDDLLKQVEEHVQQNNEAKKKLDNESDSKLEAHEKSKAGVSSELYHKNESTLFKSTTVESEEKNTKTASDDFCGTKKLRTNGPSNGSNQFKLK